jgi:hypothetical protein
MVETPGAEEVQMARLEAALPTSQGLPASHGGPGAERVVSAGSLVRLVRVEANLRFDTVAVAEAGGSIGDRIRVRLVRTADRAGEPEQFLIATIRGANLLELEP